MSDTGILGHAEIAGLLDAGVVEGGEYININPASLNVTLSDTFLAEMRHPHNGTGFHYTPCDFSLRANAGMTPQFVTVHDQIILEPGAFCLASLKEKLNLPANIACDVMLRSSAARMGIQHLLAGYGDPGYSGHLTLELQNVMRYHAVRLHAGDCIVQLRFHRIKPLDQQHTYAAKSGKYSGDVGPQGAR